jgi:cell division septation protein DedD
MPSLHRLSMLAFGVVLSLSLCLPALAEKGPSKKKAKGPTYAVQFDVPQSKEEVWNYVEMISNLGFPAYMYSEEVNGATQYYAQMGVFRSVEEAADAGRLLAKKIKTKYELVYANTNKPVVPKDDPAADLAAAQAAPVKAETPKTEAKKAEPAPVVAPAVAPAATDVVATAGATKTEAKAEPAEPEKKPEKKPEAKPEIAKKPEPEKPAPEPAPAAAVQDKIFLVQIYSFSSLDNAKETAKNYKQRGHTVTIYKLFDNVGKEWHSVSIGQAQSYENAARIAKKFADKEGKQPIINKVDASFATTRVVNY